MNCERFEELLFEGLDSGRSPSETARLAAHAELCPNCRALQRVVAAKGRAGDATAETDPPTDLVESIMRRTSGGACSAARARLGEGLAAPPTARDALLEVHLAGCRECRAMARALQTLGIDLPMLRELEPDPGFTERVVAATARRPARIWRRLARRPRLAWEGAYVGTLAMFLLASIPGSPLAGLPERTLAQVRAEGVHLHETVELTAYGLAARGRDSWSSAAADVQATLREVTRAGSARARGLAGGAGPLASLTAGARGRATSVIALASRLYRLRFEPLLDRIKGRWSGPEIPEDVAIERQRDDERDDHAL